METLETESCESLDRCQFANRHHTPLAADGSGKLDGEDTLKLYLERVPLADKISCASRAGSVSG
jgi:hypothetical protein